MRPCSCMKPCPYPTLTPPPPNLSEGTLWRVLDKVNSALHSRASVWAGSGVIGGPVRCTRSVFWRIRPHGLSTRRTYLR